jgi:hypothetical protein
MSKVKGQMPQASSPKPQAVRDYARLARRKYEMGQKLARVEKEMELAHARALGPDGVACAFGMNLKVREKLKVKPVHDGRSLVNAIIESGPDYHHMLMCHFPTLIGWAGMYGPGGPVVGAGVKIWNEIDPRRVNAIDARRKGSTSRDRKGAGTGGEA